MFQYPCPYCRQPIDSQPVEVYMADEYVEEIKSALSIIGADRGLDYHGENAWDGTFKAVFLTRDNDI